MKYLSILVGLLMVTNVANATPAAQVPLFLTSSVKHNIVLSVDDSGSMDSEVLMSTNDGAMWWHTGDQSFVGRDAIDAAAAGVINFNKNGTADSTWKKYVYLFPNGQGGSTTGKRLYGDSTHDHYAIPPTADYAFTRSPDYNAGYYDTHTTYAPWPSTYGVTFSDSDPTNARYDPIFPTSGTLTIDLTVDRNSSASNETFKLHAGMKNASGTVVASTTDATFNYFPATYYVVDNSPGGLCTTPVPANYTSFVAGTLLGIPVGVDAIAPDGACLKKYEIKPGTLSYPSGRSYADEIQNFANWFTYHRKRHIAMRGGVLHAFDGIGGIRVAAYRFNSLSDLTMLDLDTERNTFFNAIKVMVNAGGTPTRKALKHAGEQYKRTDGGAPITLACQKNFTLVFTDGYANVDTSLGIGNADGSAGAPFADTHSETLADIAYKYFSENLRPDLATGLVALPTTCPDATQDCNKNLHMNTYAVSLWAKGTIYGVTHHKVADAHASPPTWPNPDTTRNPKMVDDLYHAAVNGRGEIFLASTPDSIVAALKAALNDIQAKTSSAAAIATNSTRIDTETRVFQAKFNSGNWSGQLLAYALATDGGIITPAAWDTDTTVTFATLAALPTFTYKPSTGTGVAFNWDDLHADQQAHLNTSPAGVTDALGADRLLWLRGNNAVSGMRTRAKPLGDIVNADPVFVHAQDWGYRKLTGGLSASYLAYLAEKKTNASLHPPMLYVGANDGMLHAFDAISGVEKFAYVPNLLMPKLSKLTAPDYAHQYYVDAAPGFGDVHIDTGDGLGLRWRTLLVGGLGAGGKGVYALDVTLPNSFAANKVLWEFTHPELGELSGTPKLFTTSAGGGAWFAMFGNGYNSASGTAKLFILKLNPGGAWVQGTNFWIVDTDNAITGNGLGTVALYDANASRAIGDVATDAVYAADLQGNVWKFFAISGTAWTLAYKVFQATDGAKPQPITAPLEIGASPDGAGVMLYFGTGRYFASGDAGTTSVQQSLYGIWDSGAAIATTDRGELVAQTIDHEVTYSFTKAGVTENRKLRVTSQNPVVLDKVSSPGTYGWYLDLKNPPYPAGTAVGERVVSIPLLRHHRVIFTTLIPSSDPCSYGGTSWLMEMDAVTGGRLNEPVIDINEDGLLNDDDLVTVTVGGVTMKLPPTGYLYESGIVKTPAVISAGGMEYKITSSTSGEISVLGEKGHGQNPRSSWREIYEE